MVLENSRWRRGIQEVNRDLNDSKRRADVFAEALQAVETVGVGALAAIGLAAAAAVKEFSTLETSLATVKALTGATAQQLEQVKNAAIEASRELGGAPSGYIDGMADALRAGSSFKDVLEGGTMAIAAFGKASRISAQDAAEMLSIAKNVYGGSFEQLSNVLTGAGVAAAGNMTDIKNAFSDVIGPAHAAGQSIEQLTTTIATLNNAGISGQSSGTAWSSMMRQMTTTTDETIETMKEFGLVNEQNKSIFYDAAGNMKDLATISDILREKFGNLNKESQQMALRKIFGDEGIRAAIAIMEQGREKIEAYQRTISNTNAMDMAKVQTDTFAGSVDKLTQELRIAAAEFGEELVPVLRTLADAVAALTGDFANMDEGTQAMIVNVGATGAAFLAATLAIRGFQGVMSFLGASFAPLLASTTSQTMANGALANSQRGLIGSTAGLTAAQNTLAGAQARTTAATVAQTAAQRSGAGAAGALGGVLSTAGRALGVLGVLIPIGTALWTSYKVSMEQAEQRAKEFTAAQAEVNAMLAKKPTQNTTDDVNSMRELAKSVEPLVKEYERAAEAYKKYKAQFDDNRYHMRDNRATKEAMQAESKAMMEAKRAIEAKGIAADEASKILAGLNENIKKSVYALWDEQKAAIAQTAEMKNSLNQMEAYKATIDELYGKQNLDIAQKQELTSAVEGLARMIPSLVVEMTKEGEIHITNIDIIGQRMEADRARVAEAQKTADGVISELQRETEAQAMALQTQLSNRVSWARAMQNAVANLPVGSDDADREVAEHKQYLSEKVFAGVAQGQKEVNGLNSLLRTLEDSKARISKGDFSGFRSSTSGSQTWTPKPDEKKKKEKDPDDETREQFQARLSTIEHEAAQGILVGGEYVAALKSLQSDYTDFLSRHLDERLNLEDSVADAIAAHWKGTIDDTKKAMERQGKTAMEVAQYEMDAAYAAMNAEGMSAAARLDFQDQYYAAKQALQGADYDHSRKWITDLDKEMERAGNSEIERLKAQADALERMNSRRGTGRYTLEQENEIADDLADTYHRLGKALDDAAQSAIDMQEKMAMDEIEADYKRATDAIEDQIDALEEKVALEDFSLRIAREQEKLAELQANRAKVAADERFEFITRDRDGNLVAKRVADLARLEELDKQIADQQRSIEDMRRQEEIRLEREALQAKLDQERQSYEQRKTQTANFYAWLRKATSDANAAITAEEGGKLNERYQQVVDYVAKTKAQFEELNKAISDLSKVKMPEIGLPPGVSAPTVPVTAGQAAGAIGRVIPAVGGAGGIIGRVVDMFKGLPKFRDGGLTGGNVNDAIPAILHGQEEVVSFNDRMRIADMFAASLNHTSRLDQQMRALMATNRTVPSMSAMQNAMAAASGRGGERPVIDTGGAPLIENLVTKATDGAGIAREVIEAIEVAAWKRSNGR